jgi:hypothetical protein
MMLTIPDHLRRPAPKGFKENRDYRREILTLAAGNEEVQEWCWVRASRDFIWWCDTFAWTYDPKTYPAFPSRRFVLFDYQAAGSKKILKAIGIHDILIEKSRQMGVSWLLMAIFVWLWLFRPMQSILLGSRKEDLVTSPVTLPRCSGS